MILRNEVPSLTEIDDLIAIEDLAASTQKDADERHGNQDKRLRNRRRRQLARKTLAYAVGGTIAVWGGGALIDRGLDQNERDIQADTPSGLSIPHPPTESNPTVNSALDNDGNIQVISRNKND